MAHRGIVLVTTFLLVVSATGAVAGVDGGQEGVSPQNSGGAATVGPASPGLAWLSEDIEDRNWARHGALTLDSEGHVLVPVDHRDETSTRVEALVAVDPSDGSIAWTATGVDRDCDVAADDDGMIYAHAQAGNEPSSILAIDATDGTIVDAKTYTPPGTATEPDLHVCSDGLRLLDDGTLVIVERGGEIRALDTTTTPISALWYDDSRDANQLWGRPPAAPDGDTVHLVWIDNGDPRKVHVDAIDAATGAVDGTATVPGDRTPIQPRQGDVALVDSDGGVIVATIDTQGTGVSGDDTAHLTRLTSSLATDWTFAVGSDDPAYPDHRGFNSLVEAGGLVVGWYSGSHIVAVDRSSGATDWSLSPDSFTNNEGRILGDADGNTYWSTFGGNVLQSADEDGNIRWNLPNCALGLDGEALAVGPIDATGTVYVAVTKVEDGEANDLKVAAIRSGEPLPQGTCPQEDERLSGASRFETAIAISQSAYPQDGSADAVLLARADVFADGLAGTPLAVQENGPLLITDSDRLRPEVADEIQRLLGADTSRTVHLLGGTVALSTDVETAVEGLGYRTRRIAGADRMETAVEIARALDRVDTLMITTGFNFPDALAAGPAAAATGGAVMLAPSDGRSATTDAFMDANADATRYAIGGPTARSHPEATAVFGPDRVATAVAVAQRFFDAPPVAGLARADLFPDSLTGGAHIATGVPELARRGGPMLLTDSGALLPAVADYLCDASASLQRVFVYGGASAIAQGVADTAGDRIEGSGC